ncbi:NTP/NDP exchange transporter [Aliikangiella maris]|uniref:ADP,ATP carrier protein n=2 Tax=Aliikangiella maris TaxID=3162458 RepID=A0ABV3MUY4_9GAMM
MPNAIQQLFKFNSRELQIVSLSAAYFFLLLCAYYILRPIRETMGISRSADDLPYLFLATMLVLFFLAPVIGGLVSKFERSRFIPIVYRFISVNLVGFFLALTFLSEQFQFYVGITFYVWLSVINMLIISLFWGFMADGISFKDSQRLFPSIAIGGTIGAIFGGTIAQQFVDIIGSNYLFLICIFLLELAVIVMKKIDLAFKNQPSEITIKQQLSVRFAAPAFSADTQPHFFKRALAGIQFTLSSPYILAIAGYIFFYGLTSTFLYFQQGQLIAAETSNSSQRTQLFAYIDIWANILTLAFQLFISRQLLLKFGVGIILVGLPLLTLGGFITLAILPTLSVLIIFQTLRRSLNYGLFKPARETLFTLIPQEQKYKAKSFVDSFVYRGGDAIGASIQKLLTFFHLGVASIAMLIVPIALIWSILALYLGKQVKTKKSDNNATKDSVIN